MLVLKGLAILFGQLTYISHDIMIKVRNLTHTSNWAQAMILHLLHPAIWFCLLVS